MRPMRLLDSNGKSGAGHVTNCFLHPTGPVCVVVLLEYFLLHTNIFSENMLLVKVEKQGVGGERKGRRD